MSYDLHHILEALRGESLTVEQGELPLSITRALPAPDADAESIAWIKPGHAKATDMIVTTAAPLIICDEATWNALPEPKPAKVFVLVDEPKRIFSKVVNALLVKRAAPGIHPTANVHPKAVIGKSCHIGPFTYIGEAVIGDHTVIHGHAFIYDNVTLGERCVLHAGVVIGSDGFGYSRDENNNVEKFPHIGGVRIGHDVEIGANTCIDRGALGNTIIGNGAKIDNLVHVAHNVNIGENAFVIAHAMLGGSATIGAAAWVAPSASILQQLKIGDGATIGVGAVVTKDVPSGQTWTGSPARPLAEFLAMQKKIKDLP